MRQNCSSPKCKGIIAELINYQGIGECIDCHKTYLLKDNKFVPVTKFEFRKALYEQMSNKQKENKNGSDNINN